MDKEAIKKMLAAFYQCMEELKIKNELECEKLRLEIQVLKEQVKEPYNLEIWIKGKKFLRPDKK